MGGRKTVDLVMLGILAEVSASPDGLEQINAVVEHVA